MNARLLSLLAAAALARLILIVLAPGEFYDAENIARVGQAFLDAPLHVYHVNVDPGAYQGSPTYPWPYLPAFLPLAGGLHWLSDHVGVGISRLDRSLMVAADLALAWLMHWALGRRGSSDRERLQGAALVAFGPVFIAVTGMHGQIDALAWLPAVAAVALWMLRPDRERALACGLLIGLGIALKTTPGLALVALAPTARDRRELLRLFAAAAAVAGALLVPFVLGGPDGLSAIADYRGFAGRAGLTSLLQPRLALHALNGPEVPYSPTTTFLLDHAGVILALVLSPVAVVIWIRRLAPAIAVAALVLAFYIASPAILPQYWVWLVPFLILAGHLRAALGYQLALLPLLIANYGFLQEPGQPDRRLAPDLVLYGYVPYLWLFTLGLLAGLVILLSRSGAGAQRALRGAAAR